MHHAVCESEEERQRKSHPHLFFHPLMGENERVTQTCETKLVSEYTFTYTQPTTVRSFVHLRQCSFVRLSEQEKGER